MEEPRQGTICAAKKASLAKLLPTRDHADIGGARGADAEDFGNNATKQQARKSKKAQ